MSTVVEFEILPEEFVLAWTVKTVPSVRVEVERMIADGTERVTPYFWVSGDAIEEFEQALEDDLTVENVITLEEGNEAHFYRATWQSNVRGILYALSDKVASVLTAVYEDGIWRLRILFADHDALSAFHHYCATYNLSLEIVRLYERENVETYGKYEVTEEQEEALVTAFEAGYFSVPREASLSDVATLLGISDQAASTRLRRGYANLIENTLVKNR